MKCVCFFFSGEPISGDNNDKSMWVNWEITAAQSANQGIEEKTRTEDWSRIDRCLPARCDYCGAAARSVVTIINVRGSMFSFTFLTFSFSWGRRSVFQREGSSNWGLWTRCIFRGTIFSLLGSTFSSHFDDCVRHFQHKTKIWFHDLNELMCWLILYAMLGTMFIFLLTCWNSFQYKLE